MNRKKRWMKFIVLLIVICISVFLYCFFQSSKLVTVTYKACTDINESIRIIHLSDLHNAEFGSDNSEIVRIVKEHNPDLIFMSGDMLNKDDRNTTVILNLIASLKDIAPVYYGYGNHEYQWERKWKKSLKPDLESAGAVVVNNDYVDIEFKGSSLRIGGYMGYYRQPHMFTSDKNRIKKEKAFAEDFENTDRIKLLINHIPTQWLDWKYINKYPIDVVFCGHYHGGCIRIPFIDQGVFAPYVGWFPPYTKGIFIGKKATCVLSAGLGTEYFIPRLNNPPEIVVVELEKE